MHRDRIAVLARRVGAIATRRSVVGLVTLLGAGGIMDRAEDAAAKKRRKKKCKKTCGPCATCKKGKCKPKPAVCPSGFDCLVNGSCAFPCADDVECATFLGCITGCFTNTEGTRYCSGDIGPCEQLQPCTSTARCPVGQQCQDVGCPDGPSCVPLCEGEG